MCRRIVSILGVSSTLFLALMLGAALNIPLVSGSGTIYIRPEGNVDPPTAPILNVGNVYYTLTANIYDSIVVERNNIVLDGAGYTLQGIGNGTGIDLSGIKNVTIKNMEIKEFDYGIHLYDFSNNNTISGNNITSNEYHGIKVYESSNNSIYENKIVANDDYGIWLFKSLNNSVYGNNITDNYAGTGLYESSNNNTISGNHITNNSQYDLVLFKSSNNSIFRNNITNSQYGIRLFESSNNSIYHNNFINNTNQVYTYNSVNVWDDDYPSGGNYWSNYTGVDEKSGPNQDQPGSDGIGDTPYVIDVDNQDDYPLMSPWPSGPGSHELEVSLKAPTSLPPGNSTLLEATVSNYGFNNEQDVSLFLLVNNTTVNSTTISLLKTGSSYTINYLWTPTTDGVYNVTAYAAPVPGEIYVANNRKTAFVTVGILPPVQNINTGLYYDTIQEAIDAPDTLNGHTISVKAGTYYEHLTILKSLEIIGEDRINTIIDGNKTGTFVVDITANNVLLSGFTIQNGSAESTIAVILSSSNNVISNNKIINNTWGIYAFSVSDNTIENNIITNNLYGVYLEWATTNTIKNNTIENNEEGIVVTYSNNNEFYHNNFIDNTSPGFAENSDNNKWDDDYPSGGNYWSDYTGVDFFGGPHQNLTGIDGIGDTPYLFSGPNQDKYPLMNPMGSPQTPIANFTYAPEEPVKGEAVTFNATKSYDRDGTIASYSWDFGDGNVTSIATPTIAHVFSASGPHTVNLTVTDDDGLSHSFAKFLTVIEDSTPPTTLHDYDDLWHTSDFTIDLIATDDLSGVAETYYKINDGQRKNISADGQPLITVEATNNTLEYWSVDNAGNEELPHKILTDIKLDKTPPTGYILINNDEAYTTTLNVTLTLNASDVTSGVSQMQLSNDGINWTAWETYTTSKAWNLSTGGGIKTVYAQYKDIAGLVSPVYHDTIIFAPLDVDPPTTTISLSGVKGDNSWYTSNVTVTLSATDDISGVEKTEYSFDNITWTIYTTPFNITNEGNTIIYYKSTDKAGNIETTKTETIKIDKTTPSGSITINNGDAYTNSTSATLNLTATDVTSGVAQMRFSHDNITWMPWEDYAVSKALDLPTGDEEKNVYVQFKDNAGLISFYTDSIILDTTKPAANAGTDQTVSEDTLVTFDGLASTDENGIASYTWTFTDATPQTLSGKNPTYTFTTPGTYTVTLKVTDPAGNSATDTVIITVLDITKPIANAGTDQTVDEDTVVTFDASASSDDVGIISYTWTFTDADALQTLDGMNPTYTFQTPGIYTVTLNVTDAEGNHATDTMTITVLDITKPVANAGPDRTVNEDTSITLDGSASTDNVGITAYTWTFTDVTAKTLTGEKPAYTFNTPGVYTITLNVTDADGNWATDIVVVTVIDITAPIADAGADQTVDEDTPVTFDASGSSDNVDITGYTWTFTDIGVLRTLSGVNPLYTFDMPGTYTVTLNVTDDAGNWATDTVSITVLDVTNPIANAGQNQTVHVGETVTFDAGASSDNVGIISYEWNFGDETTGTGITTTHTYAEPGTYTVTLTVKDAAGNTDTSFITITASPRGSLLLWIVGATVAVLVGIALATTIFWRRRRRKQAALP